VSGAGTKKKPAARRKVRKRLQPMSLHPLDFDTAIKGLLAVQTSGPERSKKPKSES
jgi:hypothetical protein